MTDLFVRWFDAVSKFSDDPVLSILIFDSGISGTRTSPDPQIGKNLGVSGDTVRNCVKQHRKQKANPRYQAAISENEGLVVYVSPIDYQNQRANLAHDT